MKRVRQEQVIAYRLSAHHLSRRLPHGSLSEACAACGIQDSPPGSGLLALHARVAGVTVGQMEDTISTRRDLLRTWCMRGAPHLVPTADASVFTLGLLPAGEASLRWFVRGVEQVLDSIGMSLQEAVERTEAELRPVLRGRRLAITELGAELAERVSERLPPRQAVAWRSLGPFAPGQPVGEAVVHFVLRILSLKGIICFAPRVGSEAPFVLTDEWLGRPLESGDRDIARGELVRRHLHCYGPSIASHFASWAGIALADAARWWRLIESELSPVEIEGRSFWILTSDLGALTESTAGRDVRMLPPNDPYLKVANPKELVADRDLRRRIWRSTGQPGVLLTSGRVVGTWRPRMAGAKLSVALESFAPVTREIREEVEAEVAAMAALRAASSWRVVWPAGDTTPSQG